MQHYSCLSYLSFLRIILIQQLIFRSIYLNYYIFQFYYRSFRAVFIANGRCEYHFGCIRSSKGERTALRMSAVNSLSQSFFRMFNSTSRYLVYCTINRSIKKVTIIPLSALPQHPRERSSLPVVIVADFHYCALCRNLRHNESKHVFPLNFEH